MINYWKVKCGKLITGTIIHGNVKIGKVIQRNQKSRKTIQREIFTAGTNNLGKYNKGILNREKNKRKQV